MNEQDYIKIIVVGAPNVGKTTLMLRYCRGSFDEHQSPTIGADRLHITASYKGQPVNLQLWDIAGQEKYANVSRLYMRNALACIVVCSADDPLSQSEAAVRWKDLVLQYCSQEGVPAMPMMLLQNKCDLLSQQELEEREINLQNFGAENNFFTAMLVSAKVGININEAFQALVQELIEPRDGSKIYEDSFFSNSVEPANFRTNSLIATPQSKQNNRKLSDTQTDGAPQATQRIKYKESFGLTNQDKAGNDKQTNSQKNGIQSRKKSNCC